MSALQPGSAFGGRVTGWEENVEGVREVLANYP